MKFGTIRVGRCCDDRYIVLILHQLCRVPSVVRVVRAMVAVGRPRNCGRWGSYWQYGSGFPIDAEGWELTARHIAFDRALLRRG